MREMKMCGAQQVLFSPYCIRLYRHENDVLFDFYLTC